MSKVCFVLVIVRHVIFFLSSFIFSVVNLIDYIINGRWSKQRNIGEGPWKTYLGTIVNECGINIQDRKITNHSPRRTLVQFLKDKGFSDAEVMLLFCHKSWKGFSSYERSKAKLQESI